MGEMKFTKGSEEWQFFQDFYKLCQSLWIVEDSDEYWNSVIKKVDELYRKYPDEFCKGQLLAFIDYLDKKGTKMLHDSLKTEFKEERING